MKSAPARMRDVAGEADVVVGLEFAGFEDDFEVRGAAGFFHGGDFVGDAVVISGEENAAVDDHVDFIGAIAGGAADFLQFQAQRHEAGGEGGGDGGDFDAGIAEEFFRGADEIWINADGGAGGDFVTRGHRLHGFAAEEGDFAGGVFSFQRGEVHHGDGHLQAGEFGGGLDAALAEGGGALFDHDLVDGGDGQPVVMATAFVGGTAGRCQDTGGVALAVGRRSVAEWSVPVGEIPRPSARLGMTERASTVGG